MPYMQRLSWEGIAIHSGYLPGVPASHGCIRVPDAFARKLFQITTCGNTVTIYGNSKDFRPHWARATRKPVRESFPQSMSASVALQTAKKQPVPSSNPEPPASVRADAVVAKGSKSMRELEIEELRIRNDTQLTQADRIKELKRVWGDQRALTGGAWTGVASTAQ
jgi:lipoprotein-anchoring transpeptidase ErfK/SrfK